MTLKLNGTNSEAAPAYAGDDADTGLQCGTNELKLVTGGTARATVDSSGNVGINATSPDRKLEVVETSSSGSYPLAVSNFINATANKGAAIDFRLTTGGNSRGELGCKWDSNSSSNGTYLYFAPNDGSTGNVQKVRIDDDGLKFNSDTAAANALNDYEEGTFTPTINTGFTASYNEQAGRYTKIGNLVYVFINIDLSALSGSDSYPYATVNGLPFTASNTGNVDTGLIVAWQMNLGNSVDHAYVSQNETRVVLLGAMSNGSRVHLSPSQVWDDADGRIALSGAYTTTA